jgi:hypothetical protein
LLSKSNCFTLFTTSETVSFFTSFPETGEKFYQFGQKAILDNHKFLVDVPTVERALVVFTFCSIAIAGAIPFMYSTFGLSNLPRNCRA